MDPGLNGGGVRVEPLLPGPLEEGLFPGQGLEEGRPVGGEEGPGLLRVGQAELGQGAPHEEAVAELKGFPGDRLGAHLGHHLPLGQGHGDEEQGQGQKKRAHAPC